MLLMLSILFWMSCLLWPANGHAQETAPPSNQIKVIQNPLRPWKLGDDACVKDRNDATLCGKIVSITSKDAVLEFNTKGDGIEVLPQALGEKVSAKQAQPVRRMRDRTVPIRESGRKIRSALASPVPSPSPEAPLSKLSIPPPVISPSPSPAPPIVEAPRPTVSTAPTESTTNEFPTTKESQTISPPPPRRSRRTPAARGRSLETVDSAVTSIPHSKAGWNIGAGMGVGLDYLFPLLHLQKKIASPASLGLLPLYSIGNASGSSVRALGLMLTSNIWLGSEPFLGPQFQAEIAYYQITVESGSNRAKGSSLGIAGLLGYRLSVFSSVSAFGGAGGQYAMRIDGDSGVNFSGARPLVQIELGYRF